MLLKEIGLDFKVRAQKIDESYPATLDIHAVAEYLAVKKAEAYIIKKGELLITSDTVVIAENLILGKPETTKEAISALQNLSNKTHLVTTGVCLKTTEKQLSFSQNTEVTFGHLTEQEIEYYIKKYNPLDKAGSYGIQEWIGMIGIKNIKGDYYNVVGLPLQALWTALKKFQ